jgi:hypothetical protein
MNNNLKIPKILEQNTFFFSSANNSDIRRWRESRVQNEVMAFLYILGFEIDITNGLRDYFYAEKEEIMIRFSYQESSRKVYKSFKIWDGEKKSNIRILRKIVNQYNQSRQRNNEILNLDIFSHDKNFKETILFGSSCIRLKKQFKN